VAIVAPAGPFQRRRFRRAVAWLEEQGLSVTYHSGVFAKAGYLAGSDARRAGEFLRFFRDPSIQAIFVARGGYGLLRLLEVLSREAGAFSKRCPPKILTGMSDLTTLLNHVAAQTGVVTVHGPVLAGDLFAALTERKKRLWLARFTQPRPVLLRSPKDFRVIRPESGSGRLWGGNLATVVSTIGTRFEIPSTGILFLEEVSEPRYRIDRMFAQLALAGFFGSIRGLILGDFSDLSGRAHGGAWMREIVRRYVNRRIPVLAGLKAGHQHADVLLPIGGAVRIESKGTRLFLSPLARGPKP
jgi:muramoyltetrapeptide carboxypeptidase